MPELPEVETVCRSLSPLLVGRQFNKVQVLMSKLIKLPAGDALGFETALLGAKVEGIRRRGKYILIELDNNQVLVVHLRMTGKLLYLPEITPIAKHSHIIMGLENQYDLRFDDVRQFGAIYLVAKNQLDQIGGLATLGLEPLSEGFTLDVFQELIRGRKQPAKAFLLDQRFIAGIGNIYADEILFQSKIHPLEPLGNLKSAEDIYNLWFAIRDRLSRSILFGGSSIKDYVDSLGQAGHFQEQHRAYSRSGQPCLVCGEIMVKLKVGGRATSYCPHCQIRR